MIDLRGLTLIRPMGQAIVHGTKRIENRPQNLPRAMRGVETVVAVHSGKKLDPYYTRLCRDIDGRESSACAGLVLPYEENLHDEGIIGLMRLTGHVFTEADRPIINSGMGEYPDRWWSGPFGYEIKEVTRLLVSAVPCRGMQGFWPVPADVVEQLRRYVPAGWL